MSFKQKNKYLFFLLIYIFVNIFSFVFADTWNNNYLKTKEDLVNTIIKNVSKNFINKEIIKWASWNSYIKYKIDYNWKKIMIDKNDPLFFFYYLLKSKEEIKKINEQKKIS